MMGSSAWRPHDRWDPGNPENRDQTRGLQRELRSRLLSWDPIGVGENPQAQDEYDCLISPLMHRLHDGASERAISKWLIDELTGHFGMSAQPDRERALAKELRAWWQERTAAEA